MRQRRVLALHGLYTWCRLWYVGSESGRALGCLFDAALRYIEGIE